MDTPPPPDVNEPSLRTRLISAWSLEPDEIRYVPKGAGSYHWVAERGGEATHFITVDDLDTKPWIGRDRPSTFAGLTAAYLTAWVLHHDDRLATVVAPIRCIDDAVTVRLSDQYSVAVFPFVEGMAGSWGDPISADAQVGLLHELARLHRATSGRGAGIRRRRHELPERDLLLSALASVEHRWTGGYFSEPAREALSENAWRVRALLSRFDHLAGQLERSVIDPVVTHGEPHPGNVIRTVHGLRLIDWDTVALAEPERDLWMLANEDEDQLDSYTALTGRQINGVALEFYRLMWTLSDIASFADMFRSEHEHTRWTEQKWTGFVTLLEGASSTPYSTA